MSQVIIDVREPSEYATGHVKDAINMPPAKLMSGDLRELGNTSKDTPIILYCRTGSRSNVAMHLLRAHGYTNLTNGINQGQVEARLIR